MDNRNVLVTGPYGEAGEAILDHLLDDEKYEFTLLNRSDHPEHETYVADVTDYESIRPAFDGQDAVIHLAARSDADADFEDVVRPNIVGTHNVLKAIEDAGVEKLIFASSQRVMGRYEEDHAPELYEADSQRIQPAQTRPHDAPKAGRLLRCLEGVRREYLSDPRAAPRRPGTGVLAPHFERAYRGVRPSLR